MAIGMAKAEHNIPSGEEKVKWKKGLPAQVKYSEDINKFLNEHVLDHFFGVFNYEADKEVIEKMLESLVDLCEELGPAAIESRLDEIVRQANLLISGKSYCQT
jgi:hypothetical protein